MSLSGETSILKNDGFCWSGDQKAVSLWICEFQSPATKCFISGLLAGLYEFPTSANVSKSMTPVAQTAVPAKILSTLVQDGSLLMTTPKNQNRVRDDSVQTEKLTISSIQPVGDVLHVFSHIKKTYRVQRVILEGGANPPATLLDASLHNERPMKKIKKEKGTVKDVNVTATSGPIAVWIPLDKVLETK